MITFPIVSIIRIKNTFFENINDVRTLTQLQSLLEQNGFKEVERSPDDFFITYESEGYINPNRNTIVHIGASFEISQVIFSVFTPEGSF